MSAPRTPGMSAPRALGWCGVVRLGLVQMCLGAIVVLTTSALNRLMVVELALPAVLPGLLVALHYGIQISRPHWGFLSDARGRRTPWIIAGMAVLALGAAGAALAIPLFELRFEAALLLSVVSYALIGLGVGASGTSLLALLAAAVPPRRRAAAATITWLMMILGIALTAAGAGALLDPYSHARLLLIVTGIGAGACLITTLAVWRIERGLSAPPHQAPQVPFGAALRTVWADAQARRFTIFVALSMVAYFMQELILEPYAGLVFGFTPGQSTALSGAQNGGVFLGMLTVGIAATGLRIGSLRAWVMAGCAGSAASLGLIAALGQMGPGAPLVPAVVALGVFNGMFAVAAIGSMMALAGGGGGGREGTRMGLWGAAQALAAGSGGLAGAAAADLLRAGLGDASAFGLVFLAEAALFLAALQMARRGAAGAAAPAPMMAGE